MSFAGSVCNIGRIRQTIGLITTAISASEMACSSRGVGIAAQVVVLTPAAHLATDAGPEPFVNALAREPTLGWADHGTAPAMIVAVASAGVLNDGQHDDQHQRNLVSTSRITRWGKKSHGYITIGYSSSPIMT